MIFTRRNFAVLAILIFSFVLFGCGKKNRPTELVFGAELSGNLGSGEEHFFIVRHKEAGVVIVETSGDLGTRLEAFDQSDNNIWENTGGGRDGNARLVIFVEAGRRYRFKLTEVLTNFETWTTVPAGGQYQITANFEPGQAQVYVAGSVKQGQNMIVTLWKNGVPQTLSDTLSDTQSSTFSVFVR